MALSSSRIVDVPLPGLAADAGVTVNYTRAMLNILADFSEEKNRMEHIQRAMLNILADFAEEKNRMEGTQTVMLNLLEDFDRERANTESARNELQQTNVRLRAEMEERRKVEDQVQKSLEEKEALLKEIHHRVKNNLQIIQSVLNLQLPQIKDEAAITLFKESQTRVYAMALIHEKLYQSASLSQVDFYEYLTKLTDYLLVSYGASARNIHAQISVKDIALNVDAIIPCALVINELVSNALKHAFPVPGRLPAPGEIAISLTRSDTGNTSVDIATGNRLCLTVSNNGARLPEGFKIQEQTSLGLKLVNSLVKQLNGTINIVSGKETKFVISFTAK